jgi:hypothetical protein
LIYDEDVNLLLTISHVRRREEPWQLPCVKRDKHVGQIKGVPIPEGIADKVKIATGELHDSYL